MDFSAGCQQQDAVVASTAQPAPWQQFSVRYPSKAFMWSNAAR
jgi:hypothetical protein